MITLNHFIQEAELKNIQYSEVLRNGIVRTIFYKNDKQYIVSCEDNMVVFIIETLPSGELTTAVLEEYIQNHSYPETHNTISLMDMFRNFCE